VEVGVERIAAFRDSKVVVQQMKEESQRLDGGLNVYRDRCLDIVASLKEFSIEHVSREGNSSNNVSVGHAW
jgi:hypothetical protein